MIHRVPAPLPQGQSHLPSLGLPSQLGAALPGRPRPSETFQAELGEGHYRGQLWGGQELLELLQLLFLLLQEVSLLLGEAEAGGQTQTMGRARAALLPAPDVPTPPQAQVEREQTELREDGGRRRMSWENVPRGKTSARAQGVNRRLLSLKSCHPEGSHVCVQGEAGAEPVRQEDSSLLRDCGCWWGSPSQSQPPHPLPQLCSPSPVETTWQL